MNHLAIKFSKESVSIGEIFDAYKRIVTNYVVKIKSESSIIFNNQ